MNAVTFAWVVLGGFMAGVLNVAAAAGGTVAFLALMAAGLPPVVANATSLFVTPLCFVGSMPAVWRNRRAYRPDATGFVAAAVGALVGVGALWVVDAKVFAAFVPVLLLCAGALIVIPTGRRAFVPERRVRRRLMVTLLFGAGVYAGMFGAGVGVIVLLVFTLIGGRDFDAANLRKLALCTMTALVSMPIFGISGLVSWEVVPVLAVVMFVGGVVGERCRTRLRPALLRGVVGAMSAVAAIVLAAMG